MQYPDGKFASVPGWVADELFARGDAKPAYNDVVYPPGSPPMAGVIYPPKVVRRELPADAQMVTDAKQSYRAARPYR